MKIYIAENRVATKFIPNVYTYCENRRARFIQRICIWILDRLNCHYFESYSATEYNSIDLNDLMELVCTQRDNLRRVLRREAKLIVIGRKQMIQLQQKLDYHSFMMPSQFSMRSSEGNLRFCGCEVHLVPYVDDCCVVLSNA